MAKKRVFGVDHVDYEYDLFDLNLIKAFSKAKKPILGICRGLQVINVAFGGTLYQDIDTFYKRLDGLHQKNEIDETLSHEVKIKKTSFLDKVSKLDMIYVN